MEMGSREFTAYMYRKVFDAIYRVAFYRQQFENSVSSECQALARFSLVDACGALAELMADYGFDDSLQRQVLYVADSKLSVSVLK